MSLIGLNDMIFGGSILEQQGAYEMRRSQQQQMYAQQSAICGQLTGLMNSFPSTKPLTEGQKPEPKTFNSIREELQHNVDGWLENAV